ncbi:MAG: SpoIIE family protein phosphatase [Pseudomonadota bacterium]
MGSLPRKTFHNRLLLGLLLVSFSLAGACAVLLFLAFEENEREEAQAWMQATIVQVAEGIQAAGWPSAVSAQNSGFLRSRLVDAKLALIRELDGALGEPVAQNSIANIAVMVRTDDPSSARVIAAIDEAEEGSNHDMTLNQARRLGWEQLTVEDQPDSEQLLRAYVPIRSTDGEVQGLLRMDLSGSYFDNLWLEALAGAVAVFIIGSLLSWLISRRFSRALARPVEAFAGGMDAVASGRLEPLAVPATHDEFDALAQHFNGMVSDLRDRERLKKDLLAAAAVQQHLLPTSEPVLDGYDIFGSARYCDETGGDYFDFLPLPDSRLGIIVADVSGHGLKSALLMTAMRAVLHATFSESHGDLVKAVQAVNDQLLRDSQAGAFVTAFAGVLDAATGRLEWLSAGHDPALVLRAETGEIEALEATGIPLGILGQPVEAGPACHLNRGDLLLVGTDGISQCRNAEGEFFGLDRLGSLMKSHRGESVRAIFEQVMTEVVAFQPPGPAADDMTLVLLSRQS